MSEEEWLEEYSEGNTTMSYSYWKLLKELNEHVKKESIIRND